MKHKDGVPKAGDDSEEEDYEKEGEKQRLKNLFFYESKKTSVRANTSMNLLCINYLEAACIN